MKHTLLFILLLTVILFPPPAHSQNKTLRSEMEILHDSIDVNFVYDSSLDLNVAYSGKPVSEMFRNGQDQEKILSECLNNLFSGSGIKYEITKKYVVLTRADSKRKPKDYLILIEEKHDVLAESRITAVVDPKRNTTQTGFTRIDGSKINRGFAFMSSPDVIKTIQTLPGVSSGTELLSGLYVHGGTGSDNLFLLDNVPMYQVSHLAGLFSSFNHEVIQNVDFYKSGFPARYGGRMSSVVDVMTRPGDMKDYHGAFSIGLIDGNIQFEGPVIKDRTSFNIALRRSWLDVVTKPIFALMKSKNVSDNYSMDYNFWDANAGITHVVNEKNKVCFNFYAGNDGLRTSEYYDSEYSGEYGNEIKISWGNVLASAGWESRISDRLQSEVLTFYTLNRSDMNYSFDEVIQLEEVYEEHMDNGNISDVASIGTKAAFGWMPHTCHHVRFGGSYQYHMYDIKRFKEMSYVENDAVASENADKDNAAYDGHEFSLYIEDEMSLTDWLTVNAGLRYVLFGVPGKVYNALEPRIALKFKCADYLSVKASYTEMNQFNHQIATTYIDLPSNSWMPVTDKIEPMHSKQVAGGFYFNLPYGLNLNVEGWWKTMDNLREYAGINSIFPPLTNWESEFDKEEGRSYGGEIEFAWRKPRFDVSAGYTLAWNERYFADIYPEWYPDRNDHRHKLTLSASYRFGKRFEAYAAWNLTSGSRFTVPTQVVSEKIDPNDDPGHGIVIFGPDDGFRHEFYYSNPNNVSMPAYHRLDLGFNFRKTTRHGNESIWNLSVYNAYCRMNAISAIVEYDPGKGHFTGKAYGIVPIIPSFSYTLRF